MFKFLKGGDNLTTSTIGRIVKNLRKKHGWTQKDLAKKAGISNVTISELENGTTEMPEILTLRKLATAFGMEFSDLMNCECKESDIELHESEEEYIPNNIDDNQKTNIDNKNIEIVAWALKPENRPYLEFIYKYSKDISVDDLGKIKLYKDLT